MFFCLYNKAIKALLGVSRKEGYLMKKRVLACAVAAAGIALAGCSGSSPETSAEAQAESTQAGGAAGQTSAASEGAESGENIRIAWWGNQTRADATIAAFDAFAEKNNADFTYEYNSYDAYWETLATQSVGNNLPGIIQQVTDQYAGYINSGLLVDLTPYVENGSLDLSDCDDAYISGGNYKGGFYGVSLGANVMTFMYNEDLFAAAGVEPPKMGWTWSDFVATAREIYEKTGVQTENVALGMPRYLLEPMIRSKGQSLYSEDGLGFGFDDATKAEIVQVLQDCYDLTQEGVFVNPGDQLLWKDNSERAICTGEAAMGMNWSSLFSNFAGYFSQNLAMTTQPLFDDGTELGMYLRPAQFFSVTKDCTDPETAAKAISFFINDEEANEILNGERGIPAAKTIRENLRAKAEGNEKTVYEFMDAVVDYCRDADPAEPSTSRQCVEVLNNNVNELMYGQMTAQECVDSWIEQSLEILAK